MASSDRIESILPSKQQELLLRAVLREDREALKSWVSNVKLQELDVPSLRLLPLLNPKRDSQITGDLLGKIEETYSQTRMRNRILFSDLQDLLVSFEQAGIETLLLKGAAMIPQYYVDPGLRPMTDLDILIPTTKALGAIELLKTLGYQPQKERDVQFSARLIPMIHGYAFSSKSHAKVDLHWHVLEECLREEDDQDFWNDSHPIQVEDLRTLALSPADQILHLCVHGCKWTNPASIRWIPDVWMILNSKNEVDWVALVKRANQKRLMAPVKFALTYLSETFAAKIPEGVFKDLESPSKIEMAEFEYKSTNHQNRLWGNLPLLWYSYKRSGKSSFLHYLQEFWGVSGSQLPLYAMKRFFRKREHRL